MTVPLTCSSLFKLHKLLPTAQNYFSSREGLLETSYTNISSLCSTSVYGLSKRKGFLHL